MELMGNLCNECPRAPCTIRFFDSVHFLHRCSFYWSSGIVMRIRKEGKDACRRRVEGRHDLGLSLVILGILWCTYEPASCKDLNDETSKTREGVGHLLLN